MLRLVVGLDNSHVMSLIIRLSIPDYMYMYGACIRYQVLHYRYRYRIVQVPSVQVAIVPSAIHVLPVLQVLTSNMYAARYMGTNSLF